MKILYGVVGEGTGQALRARVVLEELTRRHEVFVVVSGPARADLQQRFPNVYALRGDNGPRDVAQTRALQAEIQALQPMIGTWPQSIRHYFELIGFHRPHVVLSDSDAFSFLFAKMRYLPVISLDHLQVVNRATHDPKVLAGMEEPLERARKAVKAKMPGAFHYLITSFFHPPPRKDRTTLVPPILRPEILAARPQRGEHLLVAAGGLLPPAAREVLERSGLPCRIYGAPVDADVVEGALTFRPFSEPGLVEDLRTCRAVVADGGFTVLSEALALRKPVLSIPSEDALDQRLNAAYLEHLGYGMRSSALTASALAGLLEAAPRLEQALSGYSHPGNAVAFEALEAQLTRADQHRGIWAEVTLPEGTKRRGPE